MTHSSLASPPAFDVPELDLPRRVVETVRSARDLATADATANTISAISAARPTSTYDFEPRYALDQEARDDATGSALELEDHREWGGEHAEAQDPRFAVGCVVGFSSAAVPVSRFSSSTSHEAPPITSGVPSTLDVALDAIQTVPYSVWKRVPTYAFLAMLLGNGCRCGGLSSGTNVAFTVLIVLGLVGLVGAATQRKP